DLLGPGSRCEEAKKKDEVSHSRGRFFCHAPGVRPVSPSLSFCKNPSDLRGIKNSPRLARRRSDGCLQQDKYCINYYQSITCVFVRKWLYHKYRFKKHCRIMFVALPKRGCIISHLLKNTADF